MASRSEFIHQKNPEKESSYQPIEVGINLDNLPEKYRKLLEENESPLLRLPKELMIPAGIVLVMGPNGSGKTTFSLGLSHALFPEQGSSLQDSTALRQSLGVAFANALEVPDDYIVLNIEAGVEAHKRQNSHMSQRQGIDRQLENLLALYDKELDLLQDNDGTVLFIDEPELGMDPKRQKNILAELERFVPYAPYLIVATNSPFLADADVPRLDLSQPEKGFFYPKEELNKQLIKGVPEGSYEE